MSRPWVVFHSGTLSGVLTGVVAGVIALSGSPSAAQAGRCPTLTIVLERSGSMLWDLAGHPNFQEPAKQRWGIAKAAIERAVAAYNNKLPLGLTMFPTDDQCSSDGPLRIPPAYDTQAAITAALHDSNSSPSGGGIPTCATIRRVASEVKSAGRDAYILLITDGLPTCDFACGFDPQDPAGAAISAIAQASSGSSPVKTFVLGIGSLSASARTALTRMAEAGGVPDRNNPMLKFFSAVDAAMLDASLARIMNRLLVDDLGVTCDDSCKKSGCASGQLCVQDRCVPDPCRALACRSGEYCWSRGDAAKCAAPCDKSCAPGSRCSLGVCVRDACSGACGPGSTCEESSPPAGTDTAAGGRCIPDPACANVQCLSGQACLAGVCHEDPCQYTSCPEGLSCLSFDGSCVAMSLTAPQIEDNSLLVQGCAMGQGASRRSAASVFLLGFLVALGLLRGRQQRSV